MKNDMTIVILWLVLIVLVIFAPILSRDNHKINLPEEISQVKESDTLKGYYDSKGILHIEFNNKRNQR